MKCNNNSLFKFTLLAFLLVFNLCVFGGDILIDENHSRGGWQGFGTGLDDSGFDKSKSEIRLEVNWGRAAWGVGLMYTLKDPIDGRKVHAIRAKVKSRKGSKTKIYAGLATRQDATIELPREKSFSVTDQWQIFEFPLSEMIFKKPELTSRKFGPDDWDKLQIVKFLLTRPKNGNTQDTIYLAKPSIVYIK